MRVQYAIGILFLLLSANSFAVAAEISASIDAVRILSVSTQIDQENSQRKGSINGGTRLYIKVVGHDSNVASNNSITIGPYPCVIPDMGVNEIFITCVTTPAYDQTQQNNLPVVVNTVQRSMSQCAQNDASLCTFSYDGRRTPILDAIVPRSIVPSDQVSWWGNFRIYNTNQIDKMLVGNLICDRFSLGLNEDTGYDGDSYNSLICEIPTSHPAGFYQSQFISKPGNAIHRSRLSTVRSSTLDTPYEIQITSQQQGINKKQSISSKGGIISFNVSGIPKDLSNVSVQWQDQACQNLAFNGANLECRLPAGLTNPVIDNQLRYVSGSGVRLQIYNTGSWSINDMINQYKKDPTKLSLFDDKIIPTTEFCYVDYDDGYDGRSRQFFVFSGYFNAPRDGSYAFQSSSSYYAKVLFQTSGESTDESTMTLINNIIEGTQFRSPYSNEYDAHTPSSDKIPLNLQKGKAYYFKIYALASDSSYFCHSTGVRIPTGNSSKYVNSVGQVSRIRMDYNFTKEIISISFQDKNITQATSFQMNFIDPYGAKAKSTASQWTVITTQFTRDSTCNAVSWHFLAYNYASNTCVQQDILDANGKKIGSTWQLTFLKHRNQLQPTFVYDSTTTNAPVYTVVRPPGANLSGTFRLKVNGQYVQYNKISDLPFNISDYDLNVSVSQILGTTNIASSRQYQFIDGAQWVLDFYGISSPILIEVVDAECKLGGEAGVAKIIIENLRDVSDQLYYVSIENEQLTQLSSQPYAQIKVNGVLSLSSLSSSQLIVNVLNDSDAISYNTFTDDATNNQLTFNGITSTKSLQLANFRVQYSGIECTVLSFNNGQIVATYPFKVAGNYKPYLSYTNNGFALTTAPSLQTAPVITSLSSSTIFSFGGSSLDISGKFFPTVVSNDLQVTIGTKQATIISISNTVITVRTPADLTEGSNILAIIYQGISSNQQQLTVNDSGAISLTNIDKTIISPVDKTLIEVTGLNFGTDKSQLSAYLDQLDNNGNVVVISKYQVNVVKAANTFVQILLPGGLPGNYKLRVVSVNLGSNNPNGAVDKIQYNILLNSFSRTTSSNYGGAKLTITGQNFSTTATDNQVLIVYSPIDSEFCVIDSSTSTQIECILPNMAPHFPQGSSNATFSVEVWGKLIAQAIVDPNSKLDPKITYNQSDSLVISSVDVQSQVYNDEQTITGTSIPTTTNEFQVVVLGNEQVQVTINSVTDSSVKYLTPNLPAGNYKLVLRSSKGDSNSLAFNIIQQVKQLSSYSVSAAGQEITITISGSLPDQDPIFKFKNIKIDVLSYNKINGQVKIRIPITSASNGVQLLHAQGSSILLDNNGNIPWVTHQTSFTVTAPSWTVTNLSVSGTDVTITGTGISSLVKAYLQAPNQPKSLQYASSSISSQSSTSAIISFANIPAGSYNIYLLNAQNAYPTISNASVYIDLPQLQVQGVTSSYAGGQTLTINGSGFNLKDIIQNVVSICGNQATIISVNASTLVASTPIAYTKASINLYSFPADYNNALTGFTTFGNDPKGNSQYLGDGDLLFYYSSTIQGQCSVGFDFGNSLVKLTKLELYPRSQGVTDASQFFGAIFQGSKDNTNWVDLLVIGTEFHLGKNMYLIDTVNGDVKFQDAYKSFRIYDLSGNSKCELVEMSLYGWKQSQIVESGSTLTCPISLQVNGSNIKQTNQNVVYDQSLTYIVQGISPNYGDVSGGTDVTITLDRAITGSVNVLIDGVACRNSQVSGRVITCKTAAKSSNDVSSLIVTVNNYQAVNNGVIFYYGNLWSKDETWGNDFAPIDGDLVYVNQGITLIVDVPYVGVLNTVIVEQGTILFANDKNIHFEAHNVIINHGKLIIGTEAAPVTGNVRITMYGSEDEKQFPTHGNKGISLHNGSIDIHGQKRPVTWSELYETVNLGSNSIKVTFQTGFDWAVGEEIVIASTDFNHNHAERRVIKTITSSSQYVIITFDQPLEFKHISVVETYNGKSIPMRAEVGLLSRNVIFEGDESSTMKSYGAHLMLHGAYTSARIRYAEFARTGQPTIMGRYPIHFHMVGDVSGSIVEGNAVHDSFARVLTIHATHYLQVKNNVGYKCAGHNIFLEDGIETNNIIQDNLIIGTLQVWTMLQTDITAASYWITNPLNTVINNRAAGGDFYGFWYEIKQNPDGPSARSDICPQGMALGQFQGNIAHSYDRFGLRIFVLTNLKYPCQPFRNDANTNPFIDNPSYEIKWENFITFRNNEDGVLAEQVGNMVFENFSLLDNKQSGFNILLSNRTDENVVLRNSIIVGKSLTNAATDGELINTRGVRTPRTDGFMVQNVHFENFDNQMTVFQSCSQCDNFMKWVQGGKLTKFSGISYQNISSKMIFWEIYRREIYEDMDGSLTGKGSAHWVTPSDIHLANQADCITTADDNSNWDNGVICSKQVVKIEFSNPEKLEEFTTKALYVQPTDISGVPIGKNVESSFYISKCLKLMNNDLNHGFIGTFLAGQIFSVQWELTGIDFTHMSVHLSAFHRGSTPDDTIVLRFPYTDFRETFEVGQMIANSNAKMYQNVTANQEPAPLARLKTRVCVHGEWYNDITERAFYLCLNQNGRPQSTTNQILERTDVNALKCKINCPLPPGKCNKDGIPRKLSDISTWQAKTENGITYNPVNSDELLIPCPWEVLIDQDLTTFKKITVQGTLRIDPTKNINIQAFGIWIKGGTIIAEGATPGTPYTNQLNFMLLGDRNTETQFLIDNGVEVGNKVIVNTGSFILHGQPAATTVARLTSSLNPNQNIIQVSSTQGWVVGDRIAIAATQLSGTEDEEFSILAINGNSVTLSSNAKYYHFGASQITLSETWNSFTQNLDLRAQVLHLTRNIKIKGQPVSDKNQWGCRVLNYYWYIIADANGNDLPDDKQLHLRGTVDWDGVEMDNCGQADTIRGALDFNKCGTDLDQVISVVKNSAIHNCPGYCGNIQDSDLLRIENTNFYNGRPILLRIFNVKNIAITKNHFVAARKRDYPYDTAGMTVDVNASVYFFSPQDATQDGILFSYNEVQGSEDTCLILPHISCANSNSQSATVGIYGNQAQTCLVGAVYQPSLEGCQWAGKVGVARAVKGFMVNPQRPGIVVENLLAAESHTSVVLRYGNEATRNVGKFIDSAVYAVAITDSSDAYDNDVKANLCKNNYGTTNLVVTQQGESFPFRDVPLGFDVICTSQVFDSALFQVNVKYTRFKNLYSDPNLAKCSNNHMMVTQGGASDSTAATYNTNVTCVDCQEEAYFEFLSANPGWNGWFGGCGLFLCTGPENVINVDLTGSLFGGKPTTSISHNSGITTSKCKKQDNWNGAYSCDGLDYIQLEWEVQGPEFNTKSTAPVMVTSLDGTYQNKINMSKEWEWDGNEPMNKRENRYISTMLMNKFYNVVYSGTNPSNIIHRIQPRNQDGEPNVWVVYVVKYQVPMNIEISVDGGSVVPSELVSDNIDLSQKTSICGANVYDWQTRTVQFLINGSLDCLVNATVLDTVRIHIKVVLKVEDFFNKDNKMSFLSKVASFLQINDYSRIKIVGVNNQSNRFLQNTNNANPSFELIIDITNKQTVDTQKDPAQIYKDLTDKSEKLKSALDSNTVPGLNPNTYSVSKYDVMVSTNDNGGIFGQKSNNPSVVQQSSSSSSSDNTLTIVLGVVISLIVLAISVVAFFSYRRYQQRKKILTVQQAEIDQSVENNQVNKEKVKPIEQLALNPEFDQLQEKANYSNAPFQN